MEPSANQAEPRALFNFLVHSIFAMENDKTPELDALAQLLSQHEPFELLPPHAKIVALDADLPMRHSLLALAQHHADGIPIWDSALQRFVDIFSTMDLVSVLHYSHAAKLGASAAHQTSPVAAIERAHLRDLHGLKRSKPATGFAKASIEDSIYHGALQLNQHRLECLPIGEVDGGRLTQTLLARDIKVSGGGSVSRARASEYIVRRRRGRRRRAMP